MKLKSVNFISNLNLQEVSGGGSSVNNATYNQLYKYFNANYIGPINLPFDRIAKFKSNISILFGLKGNYHFFSKNRLEKISEVLNNKMYDVKADFNFFHGTTSWINYQSQLPYFAYTDACFATYVEIFNNKNIFSKSDLARIYFQEAKWLKGASKVFFRSDWALEETKKAYKLNGKNFETVGLGGFIEIPSKDYYKCERNFLFISKEFIPKGGQVCIEAFKEIIKQYPDSRLFIVGDAPPQNLIKNIKNIEYVGFLNKKKPEDYKKFIDLISSAFVLVHPTNKDTNALVLTEVAYYGCPSISSKAFAIPEFIIDYETGLLLNNPLDVNELIIKMKYLLEDHERYNIMRRQTREYSLGKNTWLRVGEKISQSILHSL